MSAKNLDTTIIDVPGLIDKWQLLEITQVQNVSRETHKLARGHGRAVGAQGRGRARGQDTQERTYEAPTLQNEDQERATIHATIDNLEAQR